MLRKLPSDAEVGEYLRGYRYRAGMTAAEAGSAIGKSPSAIYKYESAKIPISEVDLVALLVVYGVDLHEAFSGPPAAADGSRKKDVEARKARELLSIFEELPSEGRSRLMEIARWAKAFYSDFSS